MSNDNGITGNPPDDVREGFLKMKGKKVRWNEWSENCHFIPETLFEDSFGNWAMKGNFKQSDGQTRSDRFISPSSSHWTLLESEGEEPTASTGEPVVPCSCDFHSVIMVTGCKCGGN